MVRFLASSGTIIIFSFVSIFIDSSGGWTWTRQGAIEDLLEHSIALRSCLGKTIYRFGTLLQILWLRKMVATIEIFLDTTRSEQYRGPSIIKALVSVNCRAQGHATGPGCCMESSEFKPISPATLHLDLSTKPQVPIIEPKKWHMGSQILQSWTDSLFAGFSFSDCSNWILRSEKIQRNSWLQTLIDYYSIAHRLELKYCLFAHFYHDAS